jgi:hypothetical protein
MWCGNLRARVLPVRWLTLLLGVWLVAIRVGAAQSQGAWSSEPTFHFAGRYEGEWRTEPLELTFAGGNAAAGVVTERRGGALQGTLSLDVGCDGSLSGHARGQTAAAPTFRAIIPGPDGARVLAASLDLVADGELAGSLSARRAASRRGMVEAALVGELGGLGDEGEEPAPPQPVQRWYVGETASDWELASAVPGAIAGTWRGAANLAIAGGPYDPAAGIESQGTWQARRVAVALCPWRGTARASGAFINEQRHEETVQLELWPTGDGRVVGEGIGRAEVFGGTPGGCEYSGGGPFSVRVVGEHRDGRFRLRLEDDEHPQLVVTTTCGSMRHAAPHAALATHFEWLELLEAPGAAARLESPRGGGPLRGTLEVVIQPASGAAPP